MLKLLYLLLFLINLNIYSFDIKITNNSTWRVILKIQTISCKTSYILEPSKSTVLDASNIMNINIEIYGDCWKWINLSYKNIWPTFNNNITANSDVIININLDKINWNVQYEETHKLKGSVELLELKYKYINKYIIILDLLHNLNKKSKGDFSIKLHNTELNELRYILGAPKYINYGNLYSNFSRIFCTLLTLIEQRLYFINNILDSDTQNEKIVKFYKELSKYAVINILFKLQLKDKTILVDNNRLEKIINSIIRTSPNASNLELKNMLINSQESSIKAINQLEYILINNIYDIINDN